MTENRILKSVILRRHWEDVAFFVTPMGMESICLTYSMHLAQEGTSFVSLFELSELLDEKSSSPEGEILYGNLKDTIPINH